MGLVSVTLPQDGTTADVSDYNTPLTTIVNALNGNLDTNNVSSVSGTKLTSATVPASAFDSTTRGGWQSGILPLVTSVSYNGNHSYTVGFASSVASYLTPGMRGRFSRTVAAPTQCTSLNGTTQYYSKTSPAGMTFTNNFVVSAWVKLTSYAAGTIASRWDGTSGWTMDIDSSGRIQLVGFNAGVGNNSYVLSYQSIPLNKWVHVAAQLDMLTFTATTTTSYVMIDGLDVPCTVARSGTNPTALIQAGTLFIGARNSTTPGQFFPGKIAQVAIFNAKITQATMITYISQGLIGTETSLISAYSFNNSINDLSSNANNLTANGSALATNADSPFAFDANGVPGGTYEFGIVQKVSTSTVTVQVPEGCAIPTTGGVSAVDYGTGVPYGFPKQKGKWTVGMVMKARGSQASATQSVWYNLNSAQLAIPIGEWNVNYQAYILTAQTSGTISVSGTLSTTNSTESDQELSTVWNVITGTQGGASVYREKPISLSAQTPYYFNTSNTTGASITLYNINDQSPLMVRAENAYL